MFFCEGGLATLTGPEGQHKLASTFTCVHCNRLVHMKPGRDIGDASLCHQCYNGKSYLTGLICAQCAAKRNCEPFEKKLDAMERRARLLEWR